MGRQNMEYEMIIPFSGVVRVLVRVRKFYFFFFFSVSVCAFTASGVPGGTFVSMNRFSILCG
jgi:hypothetical protein